MRKSKRDIAREYRDKFPKLAKDSKRTLAKKIFEDNNNIFSNVEDARIVLRAVTSANGDQTPKRDRSWGKDSKIKGEFNWREWEPYIKQGQQLKEKASSSQDYSQIEIDSKDEIVILPLSDLHLGSFGVDYNRFKYFTEFILENKNIYVAFVGDLVDNFVNFKNMKAIHGQIINPELQTQFLKSWLEEIEHKVLFATWCNHSEFTERQTGLNPIKDLMAEKFIYFDGIGIADISVNGIEYRFGITHKTRYYSSFNLTHGLKQMARKELQGCDIYIAGDKHEPAMEQGRLSGEVKLFIQLGTLKVNDAYSKRYFSYFTHSDFPCMVLSPDEKDFTGFYTVEKALKYINRT